MPAGESTTVTPTHAFDSAGTYHVCLAGSCATLAVTDSQGDGGTGDDSTDADSASDTDGFGADGSPGFGVLVGLFAVLAVAGVVARR